MKEPDLDKLVIAAIVLTLVFVTAAIGFLYLDDIKSALSKPTYRKPLIRRENIESCEYFNGQWQEFCEPTQSRISLKLKDQDEFEGMLCCKG